MKPEVEVITCNLIYKDGEVSGGYNEIHTIKYFQNVHHLIANINAIVANNLLYGCDDTVLECVSVLCRDEQLYKLLTDHYNGLIGKIAFECNLW